MDCLRELYSAEMHRIENLARRLLGGEIQSAADLWSFEIALADYQVELQEAIQKEEAAKMEISSSIAEEVSLRGREWKERVQTFQRKLKEMDDRIAIYSYVHMISRQLGDAFAWIILEMDERVILPLTENLSVPSTSSGLSLKGVLTVAEIMASSGAGFPVIHDITSCLRIGDVTFAFPGEEPITVEVKTHVLGSDGNTADLSVEVYAAAGAQRWESVRASMPNNGIEIKGSVRDGKSIHRVERPNKRLARQLERMSRARLFQTAPSDTITTDQGQDYLVVRPQLDDQSYHWSLVQHLTEEARTKGYTSQVVDDAFLYVVVYSDTPMVQPCSDGSSGNALPFGESLKTDVEANFPRCADAAQNYLWSAMTWKYLISQAPAGVRPFLLYPLSFDSLLDIIWGRLTIMVYVNLGKLAELLQRHGLIARVPGTDEEFRDTFLPVQTVAHLPNGCAVEIHLGSLHGLAAKVGFEFLSAQGFVESVLQCAGSLVEAAKAKSEVGGPPV